MCDIVNSNGPGNSFNFIVIHPSGQTTITTQTPTSTTTPSTQPSITSLSSNYSSYKAGTNNASFTWNQTGNFSLPNRYYFVYLKQSPTQMLGNNSGTSVAYRPIYFRVSSLAYPTFSVALPSDVLSKGDSPLIPGTYYLEVDYADANGNPLASVTSNAFQITASQEQNSSTTNTTITTTPTSSNAYPAIAKIDGPVSSGATTNTTVGTSISIVGQFGTGANHGGAQTTTWDFGDGATQVANYSANAVSGGVVGSHAYTAAGTYTVTLTFMTTDGTTVTSSPIYVKVN